MQLKLDIPKIENIDDTKGAIVIMTYSRKVDFLIQTSITYKLISYETEKEKDGTFSSKLRDDILTNKEFKNDFFKHKITIKLLADLGEEVLLILKELLNTIRKNDNQNNFYNWTEIENFEKLDFIGYRKILSEIIKSKNHPKINEILKDYNLKIFSSTFYKFILERNKYTHGELFFYLNKKVYVLKYYNAEIKKHEYAKVDSKIFSSYSKAHDILHDILMQIQTSYIS